MVYSVLSACPVLSSTETVLSSRISQRAGVMSSDLFWCFDDWFILQVSYPLPPSAVSDHEVREALVMAEMVGETE